MKVILISDVKKLGKKDDIVNVSDGYAENFLFKKNLAVPHTKTSKNILDKQLEEKSNEEQNKIANYKKMAEELKKEKFIFKVKVGQGGKMFGTISSKQIAEEFKNRGYDIDKKKIELKSSIDFLGEHKITINLHKQVKFDLIIETK